MWERERSRDREKRGYRVKVRERDEEGYGVGDRGSDGERGYINRGVELTELVKIW